MNLTPINNSKTDFGDGDFFCAEAIVARNDDPENRCRVQCIVPIIDENEVHEIWARRFQLYVGETGFGDYFIPEAGTEVILIGRLGDTNNLFYAPLWNESRKPSSIEFPNKSVAGIKVPNSLKFIAGQLLKLQAQIIEAVAAQIAKILAPNIEITAEQLVKILGNSATVEAAGTALLKGNTANVQGVTISINSSGSVAISGNSVTIHGRTVNKVGPPI